MADIPSKLEIGVTTGPIRGSRKIHVPSPAMPDLRVAMREIDLEPSSGEPPVRVYDTSGPYTDPAANIDIAAGLAPLRRSWILARGDVEDYAGRATRPEDNGQLGPARCAPRPARTSARCTMPGAGSSRRRWNMSPSARTLAAPR